MSDTTKGNACAHGSIRTSVHFVRLEDAGTYMAEIGITCNDCGTPFQFLGLQPGVNTQGATVDLEALELRVGCVPKGARPNPLQAMAVGIKAFHG